MYGIIGFPLTHSFSPDFFSRKFREQGIDATYHSFSLKSVREFPGLLEAYPELKGLNVTIPYKEQIMPFLDVVDPAAGAIGAVNCIRFCQGRLWGFNTDFSAFKKTLEPLLRPHHQRALVLGTGGAAKAVAFALKEMNIPCTFVSRSRGPGLTYRGLNPDILSRHTLIINTTPLGMWPDIADAPELPYTFLSAQHLLYDLIYNPPETLFLKKGKAYGALTKNGYDMLVAQAEASWDIWNNTGVPFPLRI